MSKAARPTLALSTAAAACASPAATAGSAPATPPIVFVAGIGAAPATSGNASRASRTAAITCARYESPGCGRFRSTFVASDPSGFTNTTAG